MEIGTLIYACCVCAGYDGFARAADAHHYVSGGLQDLRRQLAISLNALESDSLVASEASLQSTLADAPPSSYHTADARQCAEFQQQEQLAGLLDPCKNRGLMFLPRHPAPELLTLSKNYLATPGLLSTYTVPFPYASAGIWPVLHTFIGWIQDTRLCS